MFLRLVFEIWYDPQVGFYQQSLSLVLSKKQADLQFSQ